MINNLAKQLRDLRLRVGNPSVRELARLMEGPGRRPSMARSTIQDKISGKSAANLHQLLALVAAIAEYGRRNGTPLSSQEIDENSWRAKFVAANSKSAQVTEKTPTPTVANSGETQALNLVPLLRAGMTDLVDLIEQSEGAPVSTWLPHVASEMFKARIPCDDIMQWVASGTAPEVVQCVVALNETFPISRSSEDPWATPTWAPGNTETAGKLLSYAARYHGGSVPVIVAGLRRADADEYVASFLTMIAIWHLAPSIQGAILDLKLTGLTADATTVLRYVGAKRRADRIMEVVRHFDEFGTTEERDIILAGMASDKQRFVLGVKETLHEPELQEVLIHSVQPHMRQVLSEALNAVGLEELGSKLPVADDDELPF
ncbi:hypothetical protein [Streptomyces sp. NPDC000351]|uniref:hypothetical protein n=1 Tax=Streptomyces sp. NPDC000351 TaxID=3154250 RepID=UPI00331C10DD